MPESSDLTKVSRPNVVPAEGQADAFAKLRELARSGYAPVADDERPDGSLLLRHESAPDLILHPDGRLDLPTNEETRRRKAAPASPAGRKEKRIYWLRSLFVVAMIVIVWFLSVALMAGLLESMD
jgi:hypothetical protein